MFNKKVLYLRAVLSFVLQIYAIFVYHSITFFVNIQNIIYTYTHARTHTRARAHEKSGAELGRHCPPKCVECKDHAPDEMGKSAANPA